MPSSMTRIFSPSIRPSPFARSLRYHPIYAVLILRSADLNLTADLDVNAGLFLAPSHAGRMGYQYGKQLCGFTLDARIVTFGPDASGSSKLGAASQGGSSAAPNDGMRISRG